MERRKLMIVAIALPILAIAWYLFRPERLFVNQTVNESFQPAAAPAASATQPGVLSTGHFRGVAHETTGTAMIYQTPDGQRVLRLTDFKTPNGPDVQVYLVA